MLQKVTVGHFYCWPWCNLLLALVWFLLLALVWFLLLALVWLLLPGGLAL